MALFDVGRVCIKIAGRDARKKCVVVEVIDNNYVLIDGETRRRKCNVAHLEPLDLVVELESGAENAAAVEALKAEGIVCTGKKESTKQPQPRPKKQKQVKKKAPEPKEKKAQTKTAEKTEAAKEEKKSAEKKTKEQKPKKEKKSAEKKE